MPSSLSIPQFQPFYAHTAMFSSPQVMAPPAWVPPYSKSSFRTFHRLATPITTASAAFGRHAPPVTSKAHGTDRDKHPMRVQQPPPPPAATRPLNPDLASIPHLRDAIQKLDSTMASLLNQRKELQSHLEHAVRSQSPVQRLPGELLSSIFVMGVRSTEEEDPLMLSCLMLVCRHWAEVAVNTPLLWSRITVSKHDSIQKARRRLARSKSVPVDLTINFVPRPPDLTRSVTEAVIRAMDLFRPALWRARSFVLSVPTRAQAHAALLRCQEDAPLLESVSVHVFHCIQPDHFSQAPLTLFNGHTPRLRACAFTSYDFGWDVRPVSRLRVLKLGGYFNRFSPSVDSLLAILQACPDLEELSIRDMSDVDVDLDECAPSPDNEWHRVPVRRTVALHRLTKVSFHCAGMLRARLLLAQIAFPALRSLEFCYLNNITPLLHQLETQSLTSLPLKSLRIESCLFNELKLVQLLGRLPSLSVLEMIDNEDVSSCFLKSLSKPLSKRLWVCPNLEAMSLDGCTSFSSESLRSFVESRLPAHLHARQTPSRGGLSSASVSAAASAAAAALGSTSTPPHVQGDAPRRLRALDVTRCHQLSKETVQWLRMYVPEVRCEPPAGPWAEGVWQHCD